MSTPKFSPIPWLHPHSEEGEMNGGDEVEARMPGRSMSPLVLAEHHEVKDGASSEELRLEGTDTEAATGASADEQATRSPTPEPEDPPSTSTSSTTQAQEDIEMSSDATPTSTTPTNLLSVPEAQPSSGDPGNQPYLGRVDELDTGPIQPSPSVSGHGNREDEHVVPGTGEGGGMTPHGMSEKPVPISSTTVISEEERRIAGLRQQSGAVEDNDEKSAKVSEDQKTE